MVRRFPSCHAGRLGSDYRPPQESTMSQTTQDTPSFIANHDEVTAPEASPAIWLACGVLLVSLVMLVLLAGRGTLAASASTRPLAEKACAVLGCSLPLWRDASAFRMLEHDIRSLPDTPGALRVVAGFRNEAPWPQAWPQLLLTLSDSNGQPLAQRAFTPEEYLPQDHPEVIGAGQTASLQLLLREPAREAVAFQFGFIASPIQ
ncbi:hypothetical protein CO612_09465 [Lysobacteraceae bacterium NML71-0210]|nr:hypothetical protein CO612_09465 [Xanthomonadaceae bacterium NML71-0210]